MHIKKETQNESLFQYKFRLIYPNTFAIVSPISAGDSTT